MSNEILLILSIFIIYGSVIVMYKLFGKQGLFCFTSIATIAANIEVLIMVKAFGMVMTLGNVLFASTFLITDIVSEVYGKKDAKRAVHIGITTSIVFIILLTGPGYDILGIQKDKVESYGIPLQQVARVIAYDGNINNVEEEFVNDIIPVEKLKTVYTPQLVDSIKWNEDFNDNFFENHKKEFLKVWFSLFKKNPRIYLESWCLSTYGYWSLNTWSLNYFQANISQGNLEYIKDNDNCGVYNTNLLENPKIDLKKAFSLFTPTPSIAICIWIALFMLFYMWVNKRRKYIILLIPVLGNWLTLLIATPIAYWPRYALSILYMFPVILSIPMLCLYGKEKQDNSDNFSFVNSEK